MGRQRKTDKHLPERVYRKGKSFYYVKNNRWIRLADNEPDMFRALADVLAGQEKATTLADVMERYRLQVLPGKRASTRRNNERQLSYLAEVFGSCRPDDVQPKDIAAYLDQRSAPVAANREISLFSHVYRKAIRWGLASQNPCQGVERNAEKPDTRYIEDAEFEAVRDRAPPHVRAAMVLAYLTGQRQADILSLKREQLTHDGISFQQSKTGKRIVVVWTDALRAAVRDATQSGKRASSLWVISDRKGQRYSSSGFQTAWQRLMRQCLNEGVIAERFTFRAIRAKARSDGPDKRLLGHANPDSMDRIYYRKPEIVKPVR